ncbi:hypothetical protein J23TS9_13870 [Paenibacillus sp. J23TS9]|uniref:ester cyclase n=1 Tax=Paenibacillus sp. J23TS9 TaxID=2807193 RepID=UPI001B2292ED|nr:ester cyclase [Paenibacillus sp. J23TS9]GIP26257.1 hypothetical protein J23TS9_13870 [Paenibacillus sp. J23TS9]
MSLQVNKEIYRRFYEGVFNEGTPEIVDQLVDSNVIAHAPFPGQGPGSDGFKQAIMQFRESFPDLHVIAEDMIAEDDKVVARFIVTGTHQGDFMGIAPSGKKFTFEEIGIVRIHDGKIIEHWSVADSLSLMQQLGVF